MAFFTLRTNTTVTTCDMDIGGIHVQIANEWRVTGPNGVNSELETTAISPAINTVRETPLDEKDKDILVALPKPKKQLRRLSNFRTTPHHQKQHISFSERRDVSVSWLIILSICISQETVRFSPYNFRRISCGRLQQSEFMIVSLTRFPADVFV